MKLSKFGQKFASHSGIVDLMDDIDTALNDNPKMIFMGGGNPARLPQIEEIFKKRTEQLMCDSDKRYKLFGEYQSSKGEKSFRRLVAKRLKKEMGWCLTERNIALSNGSQTAFFVLFNLFGGEQEDGSHKTIHLPITPEYIGYESVGLSENMFSATKPVIQKQSGGLFKYGVDFSQLEITKNIAALAASRPTNPTGNVLTDAEVAHLNELAELNNIPFILDGAYGSPFPGILFTEAKPHWSESTILVLSLSKLGLPGVRTGIVVASEEVIEAYSNATTAISLASGNLGPALVKDLFSTGEILTLGEKVIAPFYHKKASQTLQWFKEAMHDLPLHIHTPEGAIFLWLWFEDLPITSFELYERLKERGVFILAGSHFFPGVDEAWAHKDECIRVSYAQDQEQLKRGVHIIAEEVRKAYVQ